MPEPNLLPLNLLQLNLKPSDYITRIPTLPEEERETLIHKYRLSFETAMQLVVFSWIHFTILSVIIDLYF